MSRYLEIGEVIETIPNHLKIVKAPSVGSVLNIETNVISDNPPENKFNWILIIGIAACGLIIYYNIKKHEDISTRNKS
ncbi:hypothetical protein ERX46_05445 [Brumimicrobium glaciale]|uniref:Uncharacterized protein n=1 Tax=Brumimicrobium glaciale TaxID=200475 RepID=A0A4Q4KP96_9FLAO|nr:hypothetical protein [Brumimicrobium glaciale]RYM34820.1 hypothetical protein ERX46_05445 [Brumimicrobium glaciale]